MGIVNETIEDRVGQSGVPNQVMPCIHGNLAGHDGRGAPMPIIEDLQKITPLGLSEDR